VEKVCNQEVESGWFAGNSRTENAKALEQHSQDYRRAALASIAVIQVRVMAAELMCVLPVARSLPRDCLADQQEQLCALRREFTEFHCECNRKRLQLKGCYSTQAGDETERERLLTVFAGVINELRYREEATGRITSQLWRAIDDQERELQAHLHLVVTLSEQGEVVRIQKPSEVKAVASCSLAAEWQQDLGYGG
jgi:hypothetical protein